MQSLAIVEKLPPDKDRQLWHALNNMALLLQTKRDLVSQRRTSGAHCDLSKVCAGNTETWIVTSNLPPADGLWRR
jgi:hypothetical protein